MSKPHAMKVLTCLLLLLLMIFLVGCGREAREKGESEKQDRYPMLTSESPIFIDGGSDSIESIKCGEEQTDMDLAFEPQQRIYGIPEMMFYRRNNMGKQDILAFGSILFIGEECYQFKDGRYQLTEKTILDFLSHDEKQKRDKWHVTNYKTKQYRDNIVFAIEYKDGVKVILTNIDSMVTQEVCFIKGANSSAMEIYHEKLYFRVVEKNVDGEINEVHISCVNLETLEQHIIYTSNLRWIGQMMVRGNGTIVFRETDGYRILFPDGGTELMNGPIEEERHITLAHFDERGLFLHYQSPGNYELLLLKEDGTIDRILDYYIWERSPWFILALEGTIFFDDDWKHAKLCEYRQYKYEGWDINYDLMKLDGPTKIRDISLLDKEHLELGYQLVTYWYFENKLQCFYADNYGNLYIKIINV